MTRHLVEFGARRKHGLSRQHMELSGQTHTHMFSFSVILRKILNSILRIYNEIDIRKITFTY